MAEAVAMAGAGEGALGGEEEAAVGLGAAAEGAGAAAGVVAGVAAGAVAGAEAAGGEAGEALEGGALAGMTDTCPCTASSLWVKANFLSLRVLGPAYPLFVCLYIAI